MVVNNPTKVYRILALAYFNNECQECKSKNELQIHHIDGNSLNNKINNFILLCVSCHRKAHVELKSDKKVNLTCKNCDNNWFYCGDSPFYATCPRCLNKVKVVEESKS